MRLKGLDLNLLVVLDVLLQECNVSRAAQRLGLGQSTVSSSLARLREHFMDELLVKGTSQMLPTALSQELRPQVRQWLAHMEGLWQPEPPFDPSQHQATLRFACNDVAAAQLAPLLVRMLHQQAPGVRLQLLAAPRLAGAELEAWLVREQVDCLVASQPASHGQPLHEDLWLCIAARGRLERGPCLSTFDQLPHIRVAGQHLAGDEGRHIQAWVPGYLALEPYVAGGESLACVPSALAVALCEAAPLDSWPLPFQTPAFSQYLSWPADRAQVPVHGWFRDCIVACAKRLRTSGALPCAIGL